LDCERAFAIGLISDAGNRLRIRAIQVKPRMRLQAACTAQHSFYGELHAADVQGDAAFLQQSF
jgi:hypothetical protein